MSAGRNEVVAFAQTSTMPMSWRNSTSTPALAHSRKRLLCAALASFTLAYAARQGQESLLGCPTATVRAGIFQDRSGSAACQTATAESSVDTRSNASVCILRNQTVSRARARYRDDVMAIVRDVLALALRAAFIRSGGLAAPSGDRKGSAAAAFISIVCAPTAALVCLLTPRTRHGLAWRRARGVDSTTAFRLHDRAFQMAQERRPIRQAMFSVVQASAEIQCAGDWPTRYARARVCMPRVQRRNFGPPSAVLISALADPFWAVRLNHLSWRQIQQVRVRIGDMLTVGPCAAAGPCGT